jgi:hypothetical protein
VLSYYSFFFLQSFFNLSFLPSAESQSQDALNRTRPKTSCLLELMSSSYLSTPNGTSSAGDTQHPHMHRFFRASGGTGNPGASSARPGSSKRDSVGLNKQRRSMSQTRIEMLKISMFGREHRRLRDGPRQ